ncbi:MAG: chromosome segregation protein SMC [Syntrophomonadaceae bacterium]
MYLKRLEIRGFKSFADHTELNFTDGINVIVGPNGCGKSNIVDAVRWVLGEANVRSLRGHKNEDVIFNGTDKKKGLGMAQVDLTVDNTEGTLPIAYNEVTVSRRIYRSGESEFYLNKTRVRMKDIAQLYIDTGLGKKGYSIIGQGELERVLNGQPFDRRLMLEEAAGTIRYRQQKEEVQQRILATSGDLLRVEDILNELRNRKTELQRKADKACSYLQLREEYTSLDVQVMANQLEQLEGKLASERQELQLAKSDYDRMGLCQQDLNRQLEEAAGRQEERRGQLNQIKDRKYELEHSISMMNSEVKLSQERIKNHRERIQASGQDYEKYRVMLDKLEQDLEQKSVEFERERLQYEARQYELEGLEQEIRELEGSLAAFEEVLAANNQQVFERASRETQLRNALVDLEDSKKKARERRDRLSIRIDETDANLKSALKNIEELRKRKQKAASSGEKLADSLRDAEQELYTYSERRAGLEEEYQSLSSQRLELAHKWSVWQEVENSRANYSEGVRGLLLARDRGEIEITGYRGLISDLIEVPARLGLAIGTVLGAGMENIVVETSDSARLTIELLKKKRWGRITFLPLDNLRYTGIPDRVKQELKREAGVVGLADELVKYEAADEMAVKYLLGRVVVVDDMASGFRIFRKYTLPFRIVTMEGETINTSGAITGGTRRNRQPNMLERRQEGKIMSQQLDEFLQAEEASRGRAAEVTNQIHAVEKRLTELRRVYAEQEFQLQMLQEEERRILELISKNQGDREHLCQEKSQLDDMIRGTEAQMEALDKEYRDNRAQNTLMDDQSENVRMEMETTRRDCEVKKERYASYQEQLTMKKRELENDSRNIDQFIQVRNSYRQSAAEANGLQMRLRQEVSTHLQRIESSLDGMNRLQLEMEELMKAVEADHREDEQELQWLAAVETDMKKTRRQREEVQEQIRMHELRLARLETELVGLQTQWQEKYPSCTMRTGHSALTQRQLREYRKRIEELRNEIEALGSIDIESIKEYDDLKERYEFLSQQTDDLRAAKASLENLLHETEKVMAKNFREFMARADESFRLTFQEIFNGGEARLEIESTDDLTAGVDLVVKMPGKRSQSLNLLSGGERALTCIAFIFALLRIKPSPFCLLDEIDASLDEANLQRFADFLVRMAQSTQFIVITHRPATIEAGSNIYGITMPQEGISAVLSLQYEDARSMAG